MWTKCVWCRILDKTISFMSLLFLDNYFSGTFFVSVSHILHTPYNGFCCQGVCPFCVSDTNQHHLPLCKCSAWTHLVEPIFHWASWNLACQQFPLQSIATERTVKTVTCKPSSVPNVFRTWAGMTCLAPSHPEDLKPKTSESDSFLNWMLHKK